MPGVEKGSSPEGHTGRVVHEAAEVCSTNVAALGARHPIKKPNSGVPSVHARVLHLGGVGRKDMNTGEVTAQLRGEINIDLCWISGGGTSLMLIM